MWMLDIIKGRKDFIGNITFRVRDGTSKVHHMIVKAHGDGVGRERSFSVKSYYYKLFVREKLDFSHELSLNSHCTKKRFAFLLAWQQGSNIGFVCKCSREDVTSTSYVIWWQLVCGVIF